MNRRYLWFVAGAIVIAAVGLMALPISATVAPAADLQIQADGDGTVAAPGQTCGPRNGVCKRGGTTCRCEP